MRYEGSSRRRWAGQGKNTAAVTRGWSWENMVEGTRGRTREEYGGSHAGLVVGECGEGTRGRS
ncbi:MAG: hypothetical protein K6F51_08635 [Acetatifactor sp.]|nr:hypothetical protein [Acetatifactor sp.]